jgi:hypothetical protein
MGLVACAAFGGFWLGSTTATQNTKVVVNQVCEQQYGAGFAAGMNQSKVLCDSQLHDMFDNCEAWK